VVKGDAIPYNFMPAVEKGVRQALELGVIAGYPVEDLRVTVYDGQHHSVDNKGHFYQFAPLSSPRKRLSMAALPINHCRGNGFPLSRE
jgi:translation elongation factor EF-G